jgi:hypothetical protein
MFERKPQKGQNMKPITRQLIVAVLILALVTVASLGIRQIRFSARRARTTENSVIADTESGSVLAESPAVDPEPEPQNAKVAEAEVEEPMEDYPEPKSLKGDYAKAKGSKGSLEKISLGENENLYVTGKGETWYVAEGPDGKTTKMRVEIDEATGEMTVVDVKGGGKSGALQRVSMGDGYDMYITDEGQTWYVGGGSKSRVEIDEASGEITVLEQYGDGDK